MAPVVDETVGVGALVVKATVAVDGNALLERAAGKLEGCKDDTWANKFAKEKKARVLRDIFLCGLSLKEHKRRESELNTLCKTFPSLR